MLYTKKIIPTNACLDIFVVTTVFIVSSCILECDSLERLAEHERFRMVCSVAGSKGRYGSCLVAGKTV